MAGRRAYAAAPANAPTLPVAVFEWEASDAPVGDILPIKVTDGRRVQEIQYELKRPSRHVAFPSEAPAAANTFDGYVHVVKPVPTRTGARATLALESDALRVHFAACHVAPESPRIEIKDGTVAARIALDAVLAHSLRQGDSWQSDAAHFAFRLLSIEGVETELRAQIEAASLARLLFAGLPSRPLSAAPPYRRGAPLVLVTGDPAQPAMRTALLRPEKAALGHVAAVALQRSHRVVVERCQYIGDWTGVAERVRWDEEVSVYEARSGRLIGSRKFAGAMPEICPPKLTMQIRLGSVPKGTRSLEGKRSEQVAAWLKTL